MGIRLKAVLRAEHADDGLITLGGLEQDLSQASNEHVFLNGRIGTKNLIAGTMTKNIVSFRYTIVIILSILKLLKIAVCI